MVGAATMLLQLRYLVDNRNDVHVCLLHRGLLQTTLYRVSGYWRTPTGIG